MSSLKPLLLYIHGMNGSSRSRKAVELRDYIQKSRIPCDFQAPTLPTVPVDAAQMLYDLTSTALTNRPVYMIGSSLGGFYGTWLMQKLLQNNSHPVKLVLVNPAVDPQDMAEEFMGPQTNPYTQEEYEVTPEYVEQLRQLKVSSLSCPDNILLLLKAGDEVLDYRAAEAFYNECPQRTDPGGDHSFADFESNIPLLLSFFSPALVPS